LGVLESNAARDNRQPQDYAEAMRWFRKAADQGNADAQANIGDLYYYGHGVAQNYAVSGRAIVSFDVLVDARRPIGTLAASAGQPNRPR